MKLLLDTQVVLWQLQGTRPLSQESMAAIERAGELSFSVVSFAEIGIKTALGKLKVPRDLREHVMRSGLRILGLDPEHCLAVAELPLHHKDPFDRLLIAQARREGLTILSADQRFADYEVSLLAA